MINNYYKLDNKYNKRIALFSDIHFSSHYSKKTFSKILKNLIKNKPDFICISGDIIDDVKVLESDILKEQLYSFLKQLGKIAPTILSYGNHDEVLIHHHSSIYKNTTTFFNNLNRIQNIYFLDNKSVNFDDINFIGLHPTHKYYNGKENYDLKNDINNIKDEFNKEKYNILLFHSPINILEYQLPVNLILSGHMHNGLIPPFLKKLKGNKGLVGPYFTFFPKNSRGMIEKNNTKLVISGGVKKISNSSSFLLRILNPIYSIDIDYIDI